VRLHEANAGLIAVSEVMRALLDARDAGIPVIVLIGGATGCFGGMGIVARCANAVLMSEEGRLAMSGPEVIETTHGVEEYDARDRALVWRTSGGKHRYLLGDCDAVLPDSIEAFGEAACAAIARLEAGTVALTLEELEAEQRMLARRLERHGGETEPADIWRGMGIADPAALPMLEAEAFMAAVAPYREGAA
jgi:malonate decarboxylase beta subunit